MPKPRQTLLFSATLSPDIERFARGHQDWFEEFLELPYGVPSHDTFSRVFARLETEEFQRMFYDGALDRLAGMSRFEVRLGRS